MHGVLFSSPVLLSVLGSTAGGAAGSLAAQGATRLGAKALFKAGLQTNIFAKAVNEGFGGAAFSVGNAVTRSAIDPNYNPTADEIKQDAAISFAFQAITSAARLAGRTDQAKAALEQDVAALKRDFETIAKAEMAGEITPTDTIERMKIRSATLRVTIEGTRYIGQGKMVDDALAFLDQMDDFLAEATKHNAAAVLGSGAGFDSRQTTTTSEMPQGDAQTMGPEKGHIQEELPKEKLLQFGDDGAMILVQELAFPSDKLLSKHFNKHGAEFGEISTEEYLHMASLLAKSPLSEDIVQIERSDGSIAKYRFSTNEFLAVNADGTIRTFFKPDNGGGYWQDELDRNMPLLR